MSTTLSRNAEVLLAELYAAEDLQELYATVARQLAERHSVEGFAIRLLTRRHESFLEYEHGRVPDEGGTRILPLEIRGQDFGTLHLAPETDTESEELRRYSEHLALALYHHKLLDDQGRLIDESLAHVQALKAMGELLGELDQELVLNRTLKFFIDLVNADVGAALLYDEDRRVVEARWGLPAQILEHLVEASRAGDLEPKEGMFQRVLLKLEDTDQFSLGSVLRMPIQLKAPYSAEIFLISGERLELNSYQRELMSSCHVIGSIALQKTLEHQEQIRQHRLNEQLMVARDIQRQLLPESLPCTERMQIAGRSLPAHYVGGDYYDVFELENGDLLAIVADVSGKGVQAAIRMSGLRAMLHGLGFQDLGPGETLARLNQFLCEGSLQGHFVTACCIRLEDGGRRIRLATAGHEPALLADSAGDLSWLEYEGGLPLGLKSGQEYPEEILELACGDTLLLYTDGMTDTSNESGKRFGTDRISRIVEEQSGESAANLLDRIFAELEEFRGDSPWADDLTALAFCYREEGTQ